MDSLGLTLNSFRFILDPGPTRSHKGKGNHPIAQGKREDRPPHKGKGKGLPPYNFTSDSTLHPNTARHMHARNETTSRFGGASLKTHLDSLGLTWTHLDSCGLTWSLLNSLGPTWTHLDSLGFILDPAPTRSHKGKGNHRIAQRKREDLPTLKGKGKGLTP